MTARWSIIFTAAAAREIADLPADMQARLLHIAELLTEFGPHEVGMPHVRPVGGKLWEMRLKGADGIARAIYFAAAERRLVVVRAFVKKTRTTPQREIELAERRMKEWSHER
jgi:phage-related protein